MIRYVIQRLLQAVVVLLAIVTVVFVLERVNSNPAALYAAPGTSVAEKLAISRSLGLEDPLPVQYLKFLSNITHGDLGVSFVYHLPVRDLLIHALPYSAGLGFVAFVFASVGGVLLGTVAALNAGTWIDALSKGITLVGQSLVSFWLGMLLVMLFSIKFQLLPAYGPGTVKNLILPAAALAAMPLAAITRLTRSAVLEVVRADHILFERTKGVSPRVLLLHLLRNASLPIVTFSGIQLGSLLSGTITIELLFAWPGLGLLAIQAVDQRDYPIIQGVVLLETTIFVILNLLVDLTYGVLDPRLLRRR